MATILRWSGFVLAVFSATAVFAIGVLMVCGGIYGAVTENFFEGFGMATCGAIIAFIGIAALKAAPDTKRDIQTLTTTTPPLPRS